MRTESEELPHTPEQTDSLASVANDLVKSFTSSHVTEERAEGIRLAFKDVLLVSIAVPAPTGQTVTIGNFAVTGDTDMTMVPIADSAAGHTLQHNWAISTSLLSGYKDIPAHLSITSLVSMPLFESNSSSMHGADAVESESPRPCRLSGRSFSCPNLDEFLNHGDNAYDPSSCSCPSIYSQDWSEGESTSETVSDKPESDVLYCYATSEPRVVGALIMGIKGDRWPRRRDVDELAKLLGPLLAPFVSKAVNLASAAYVARTLARPAIPMSKFEEASLELSGAAATSWSADVARRTHANHERGLGIRSSPLRRSATASWVLSEGEREIFTSLISSPIMTQPRSLSGSSEDPCLPTSPAFASPLVSSMVCAASLVGSVSCSPAAQIGPSIAFTFTPSIPLIEEGAEDAGDMAAKQCAECTPEAESRMHDKNPSHLCSNFANSHTRTCLCEAAAEAQSPKE